MTDWNNDMSQVPLDGSLVDLRRINKQRGTETIYHRRKWIGTTEFGRWHNERGQSDTYILHDQWRLSAPPKEPET